MPTQASYNSAVSDVASLDAARRIILSSEGGLSTDERWRSEIPYLVDFLAGPRHQDTARQFECTRLITAGQVKAVIRTNPGFGTAT
jgi:hypothetical protein